MPSLPLPTPPDMNCTGNNRCNFDASVEPGLMINLTDHDYINLSNTDNGVVIRLINYTLVCERTKFIKCSSNQGGGGIYIVVSIPTESKIVLENLTFIKCKAIYGGAVYIYCNQDSLVRIKSCYFGQNEATKNPSSNENHFFGGSACYLQVKDLNITDCFFNKNIGSSVKINNTF